MKRLFFLLLLFLPLHHLSAQKLEGTVKDKTARTPVDVALVRVWGQNNRLMDYAYTDEKGHFSLKDQAGVVRLDVSCLGYQLLNVSLDEFRKNSTLLLSKSTVNLREVVVQAKRIEEKADTLVYSVAGFAHPQDRSIADVLAKMPGIEVKTDGRISFNGKSINKFYIEGMDLLNDRYSLASQNLDRKKVKRVEVLKNHQPIAALRGKSFSEQAAINLILEDDAKLNLTGTADVGAGVPLEGGGLLHDNRLLAMLFRKNRQNFSMYKSNSTGKDITQEMRPTLLSEDVSETQQESNAITTGSVNQSSLPGERYQKNQSHLVAMNHLEKVGKQATLRTQLSYLNHYVEAAREVQTDYRLVSDTLTTILENLNASQQSQVVDGSLNYELNSDKLYVGNRLKTSLEWVNARLHLFLNHQPNDIWARPGRKYVQNNLHVTMPMGRKDLLDLQSSISYNDMPQQQLLIDGQVQALGYRSLNTMSHLSMTNRLLGFYLRNQLSLETHRQELPGQQLNKVIPGLSSRVTYKNHGWNVEGDVHLRWWNVSSAPLERYSALLPDAHLSARYALNGSSNLTGSYGISHQFQSLVQLYRKGYFSDYRTQRFSTLELEPATSHVWSLRYEYTQPIKGFFFSVLAQKNLSGGKTVTESRLVDGRIYQIYTQPADYTMRSENVNARMSKSVGWWKGIFSLSGYYSQTESKRLISGQLQDVRNQHYYIETGMAVKPLKALSVDVHADYEQSIQQWESLKNKVSQVQLHATFFLALTEALSVKVKNDFQRHIQLKESLTFTDLSLLYHTRRVDYELIGNNLLGIKQYEQTSLHTDYVVTNMYRLRPQEVLLKVSLGF